MNRSLVDSELSLFSYEILGLVGSGGAGAHDLLRMAKRGRLLAWAGESQYYVEPKRLARLGYLEARKEPGKTRERDLVGEEVTRDSLASLRDDITDLRERLDDSERAAKDLPHREKYLLLAIDFLRGLLDLHGQLVDEVEREFAAAGKASRPRTQ